jgi:hypothetical protein
LVNLLKISKINCIIEKYSIRIKSEDLIAVVEVFKKLGFECSIKISDIASRKYKDFHLDGSKYDFYCYVNASNKFETILNFTFNDTEDDYGEFL